MVPAILRLQLPVGSLPVKGMRCPVCGEEMISARDLADARAEAERLGLMGPRQTMRRKVTRNGTSTSVNLPPEMLSHIGAKAGSEVDVSLVGDSIVIRRAGKAG